MNPNDEAGKVSSYLIEDGSYIRLKQLELGYTLPKQTLSKIGLQQCRVYLNAENLLTLTKSLILFYFKQLFSDSLFSDNIHHTKPFRIMILHDSTCQLAPADAVAIYAD